VRFSQTSPDPRKVAARHVRKVGAPVTDLDLRKTYYHGTPTEKAAKGILRKGIQPPDLTTRKGPLRPVEGRVYITPELKYGIIYALGADMAGSREYPERFWQGSEYGYLFVIPGRELREIHPDEDSVGEMIGEKNPPWLWRLAQDVLAGVQPGNPEKSGLARWVIEDPTALEGALDAYVEDTGKVREEIDLGDWESRFEFEEWLIDHPKWDHDRYWTFRDESLLDLVEEGEFVGWAEAGKLLIPHLTADQELDLIDRGAHIAHEGRLEPSECWKIHKSKAPLLKPDGSNFFKIAERCR